MANSDKNISIIPNRSLTGQPQIIFTGQGNDPITLKVLDSTIGSLSFEGSAGQLLSITDSLSSGSIFSVNDISGIPSIDVNADGTVALAPFSGNIAIGVTSASFKLHVNGTLYAASAATFNSNVILSNGNLQTTTSTFNLITNTASTINIGTTSGSTISIASTTGTTTVNNSAIITGNLTVNGGTITSTATTFNLLNTTVTNANVLGASDTIILGSANGTATIRNAATRVNGTLTVTGATVLQGAASFNSTLTVTGATVLQGAASFNSTLTVTGATVVQGALSTNGALSVTGTSTLIGDVTASGDIAVNGGDITSTATTFNLLNATVTGLNVGGAANTVLLGGTGGTTTIRNAGTNINGTLTITGVSVHQGAGAFNSTLTVTGATVVQGALSTNGALSVTGTSTLIGDVTASGDIAVNGGDITSTATTFNLLNATITNANVLGAANTVVIGGTGGTTTIRNAGTNINGTLTVTGVSVHQGAGVFNSTLSVTGVTTLQGASTLQGAVNMNSTLTVTGISVHQGAGSFNSTLTVTGVTTLQGASTLQSAVNMNSTLTVTGVSVHQGAGSFNSTLSVTGTSTLIGDVTAGGDIAVNGGDITSTATTFNLLNATVTNANILGAANTILIGGTAGSATIRNSATAINGSLTVTGASTFVGVLNATTITSTDLLLRTQGGDEGGQLELGTAATNSTLTGGAVVIDVYQNKVRFFEKGAATRGYFIDISNGTANAGTQIGGSATAAGSTTQVQYNNSGAFAGSGNFTFDGSGINVNGLISSGLGITTTGTTFNFVTNTASTINIGTTSGSTISIGNAGGTTTIRNAGTNINGTLTVTGVSIHQGALSTNSTLSVTGTSTLIGDVTASGDIAVNGGDITSTATTFNLLNATVTNANVLGAANTVVLGGTGGTATIRNAGTNINGTLTVTGISVHQGAGAFNSTLSVTGVTTLQGASTLQGAVNMNSTLTVTGVTVIQGALSTNGALSVTGTSTLIGDVTASGDLAVNGGDITSTATTFNLLNATVTNANVLGAANTVVLGGTGGTTTIRNAGTNINGTLTVTGVSVHQGAGTFNSTLTVTGATVIQGALSTNGALSVTGTSSLIGDVTASGDIAVNGGDITSTATTFNLLNTTVTGLNLGGAANTVVVGGTGGATTIRNAGTNINGTLTVTGATVIQGALSTNSTISVTSNAIFVGSILANGGTITSTATTFNLLNTTVTNANVLGAATIVVIGANSSGSALIRNSNILLGGTVTGTTTISTTTGTAAHLTISPQGNLTLSPLGSFGAGGIRPSVTVPNNSAGTGTISISGAYVLIGNRNDGGSDYSGEIRIQEQYGNDYFGLKAPDTMAASTTYTLPSAFPASAGYVLQSTTTGLMSWAAPSSSASLGVTATSASENYKLVFTDVNATNTSASLLIDTTSGIIFNPSTDALIVNGPLSTNSTLSVTGEATFAGSILANGGTITSSATTFNLLNTTVTNANVLGAANTILIGSISGTTTIRNAGTNINGTLTVSGSSSFGAAVDHTFGLSNRGVLINAGKGTSEILSYGNETLAVSGMGGNGSLELFGGYVTVGDDGNNDGTQIVVADNAGQIITYTAANGHVFNGAGSFSGILTLNAGVSVTGTSYFSDPSGIQLTATAPLRFYDADSSHYVAFKSGATVTSNITWTLPTIDGTSSQVLSTNGSGTLSWATAGGGAASGSDTYIQFNDGGSAFGGDAGLTYTKTSDTLSIGTTSASGIINMRGRGEVRFNDTDSTHYVSFKSGATVTSNITWTLPTTDGAGGQVLSTDGAGTLSWATPPAVELVLFNLGII